MPQKDIIYFAQLFKFNGKPKLWEELRNEIKSQRQLQVINNQIIHSILKYWKDALKANSKNIKNVVFQVIHKLILNCAINFLKKFKP